jgi:hypothetical protein
LLHAFPEAAQSVQAVPHAVLAFADAHPASVQQVLQLLGPQGSPAS